MLYKLFLLFCLYLPFQVALNPYEGVDLASARVFILLLFFLWLAEGLKRKNLIIPANFQTLALISFLFFNLISIFIAKNTDWSTRKLLFLFSVFPIYFVAGRLIKSQERLVKVVKTLLISGTVVATTGILQFLLQFPFGLGPVYNIWAEYIAPPFLGRSLSATVSEYPSWLVNVSGTTYLRATSVFPDPHMFSFFLGMLLPLALGLFLKNKQPLYFISFAVLTVADILTFSRGGYLGLSIGILALFIFSWKKIAGRYKIAALLLLALLFVALAVPGPVSNRFFSSFNLKEGSNEGRLAMWTKAWEVTKDSWFLGVGIGNYPLEIKASADYREPIYAHNTYLDIAAETGMAAVMFWIILIISSFFNFLRKSKKDILFLYAATSLVIFSVHSLVETGIYSPVVLTLFLIIISFSNVEFKNKKLA